MSKLSKIPLLLHTIRKSPSEFRDRLEAVWDVQRDRLQKNAPTYQPIGAEEALEMLGTALSAQVRPICDESGLIEIENEVARGTTLLGTDAPFTTKHNGDTELARFCYVVSRLTIPQIILETGVAYGVTSAYILQALHTNSEGQLWSIDLPPLGREAEEHVGFLIPPGIKDRWHLRRGQAKRVLPGLLPSLGRVDMFIQDSLHTYHAMTDEIMAVWPFIKQGGVVIIDDIGDNEAFSDLCRRLEPAWSAVVQEGNKDSMFGFMIKRA